MAVDPGEIIPVGRVSSEGGVPVTLCNEEYQRFRDRSAMPATLCLVAVFILLSLPSEWTGVGWARGVFFAAMMVFGIVDFFRRESFFNAIVCPHCGEPAGELVRRDGFNYTSCGHCRKEGQTDLRVSWFTGPASQRWPR